MAAEEPVTIPDLRDADWPAVLPIVRGVVGLHVMYRRL
jgi:hypothetical protein